MRVYQLKGVLAGKWLTGHQLIQACTGRIEIAALVRRALGNAINALFLLNIPGILSKYKVLSTLAERALAPISPSSRFIVSIEEQDHLPKHKPSGQIVFE